jgi:hypothetical protein
MRGITHLYSAQALPWPTALIRSIIGRQGWNAGFLNSCTISTFPTSPLSPSTDRAEPEIPRLRKIQLGLVRIGLVTVMAALITAYFWVPLVLGIAYVRQVPIPNLYGSHHHGSSHRSGSPISLWLHGQLLDYGRPALLTAMAASGIIAAILKRRDRPARVVLGLSAAWTMLYFFVLMWPPLARRLPLGADMVLWRSVGGVDMVAILLMGLAGEALWTWSSRLGDLWHAAVPGVIIFALMIPVFTGAPRLLLERSSKRSGGRSARFKSWLARHHCYGEIAATGPNTPHAWFFKQAHGFSGSAILWFGIIGVGRRSFAECGT